jgi:hypothetical protein
MELATDIMAIVGWASIGGMFPGFLFTFRKHEDDMQGDAIIITCAISFGLIAASIVLG